MKILASITLLLSIIIAVFIYRYKGERESSEILSLEIESRENMIEHLKNKYTVEKNTNFQVIDSLQYLTDLEGNTLRLKDVINKQARLVFRYSSLNCQVCVDEEIARLKTLRQKIGDKNILILTYYQKLRDLIAFSKLNQVDFPIYIVKDNTLGLDIEKQNVPFFFILDDNFLVKETFIPIESQPQLSITYFDSIIRLFTYDKSQL